MNTLFPLDPGYPPGFDYFPGFLSGEEEAALIERVSRIELHSFNFQGFEAKHRHTPPFDVIAGISLAADCTFRFKPYDKSKQGRGSTVSIAVERRSLYVIKGEARSEWQHSIAAVKAPRYSITLRTLRERMKGIT
jgi:hypothetical protein